MDEVECRFERFASRPTVYLRQNPGTEETSILFYKGPPIDLRVHPIGLDEFVEREIQDGELETVSSGDRQAIISHHGIPHRSLAELIRANHIEPTEIGGTRFRVGPNQITELRQSTTYSDGTGIESHLDWFDFKPKTH